MAELIDAETGELVRGVPQHKVAEAIASGFYLPAKKGQKVELLDESTGAVISVNAADQDIHTREGAAPESVESALFREDEVRQEREHGGLGGRALTVLESGAGSASFGLTDHIAGAIGGEEYREDRKERRHINSTSAFAGDLGGMLLPALATGGASVGAKLLAKTPSGLAAKLGAKGGVKALAAEGAITGAGQYAHELAVSGDAFDLEQAAATVALGGALGGGVGIFSKAATKGLTKAQKVLREVGENAGKGTKVSDDLARMNLDELDSAMRTEQKRVGKEIVTDSDSYHALSQEVDPMLLVGGTSKHTLAKAKKARANLLKNPEGLAESAKGMLTQMRIEAKVLREIADDADNILAKLAHEDGLTLGRLSKQGDSLLLKDKNARKYLDWAGKRATTKTADEGIEITAKEMGAFKQALSDGSITPRRQVALDRVDELLERNVAAQTKISGRLEGTSDELLEITSAKNALKTVKQEPGLGERIIQGVAFSGVTSLVAPIAGGLAPVIGAMASKKLMGLTFGRLGKSAAEASARTAKALDTLMTVGAKYGKVAAPVATRSLMMASYGALDDTAKGSTEKSVKSLLNLFRERSKELLSQVERGPDGIRMHRAARNDLAAKLAPVRVINPAMADTMESLQARKVAYLANKLPKRPDFLQHATGPDAWTPSDIDIREFARHMAAAEDPGAVEERLADGTLSPEDAEAYRTIYPEKYAALQRDITQRLSELQATLNYQKRLSLSIFTGVAVEPSMDPRVFDQLQRQFTEEPGTDGGTQAPIASQQFGSVKNHEATPSQERQQ